MASRPGSSPPSPQVRTVARHVAAAVASTRRADSVVRSSVQLKPQCPVRVAAAHVAAQVARSQAPGRSEPLRLAGARPILQLSKKKQTIVLDQGSDEQLGGLLDQHRVKDQNRRLQTAQTGESGLPMYLIPYDALSNLVRTKISNIKQSQGAFYTDWRDIHVAEEGHHLPLTTMDVIDGDQLTPKQREYWDLSEGRDTHKHQFIEYHVTNSGHGQAFRLLYDFYRDLFYVTTTHYNVWHQKGGELRNPFLLVTGIP
jgi:hypothetical protein